MPNTKNNSKFKFKKNLFIWKNENLFLSNSQRNVDAN